MLMLLLPSRGHPELMSWGHANLKSQGHLESTFQGSPLENVFTTSHGGPLWDVLAIIWAVCWICLNFFLLTYFQNLFDWPNLSKSNTITRDVLEYRRRKWGYLKILQYLKYSNS